MYINENRDNIWVVNHPTESPSPNPMMTNRINFGPFGGYPTTPTTGGSFGGFPGTTGGSLGGFPGTTGGSFGGFPGTMGGSFGGFPGTTGGSFGGFPGTTGGSFGGFPGMSGTNSTTPTTPSSGSGHSPQSGQDYSAPTTPPPTTIPPKPQQPSLAPGTYAISSFSIGPCYRRWTYLWPYNGPGFWMFIVYLDDRSIGGYTWGMFGPSYTTIDPNTIAVGNCNLY